MRPTTATRAATRSATSAGRSNLQVPEPPGARAWQYPAASGRAAVAGARRPRTAGWPSPRPARTRSPGTGRSPASCSTGRSRPFPHGFPPEVIERFEREIGRQTLGNEVASGTEIIERLGDAHVASGTAHRLHLGRQRVPDCRARRRRAGARAVPDVRGRLSHRRGRPGRRPRDRAAVCRAVRRVHAHGKPARLRDAVAGADAARSPVRRGCAGDRRSARSRICSRAAASRAERAHAVRRRRR